MNILNYGAQINALSMVRHFYVLATLIGIGYNEFWKYIVVQNRNQNLPTW